MIQSHIKNLLYAYDCVIIPDFGGLITHYAPAKIHPVKHTFSPPSKRIAFNEQLKVNDGLLISTLAKQQQWPLTQAQQAVAEFVQDLKVQLLNQHRFELQDVGVFRYNAERKLVFESIESDNFLEQSFGLPELVSKPINGKEPLVLRGKYKDQTTGAGNNSKKPVGRFQKLYRIGASLVLGGITVSAVYLFSLQNNIAMSSLNPFAMVAPAQAPVAPEPITDSQDYAAYAEDYSTNDPAFEQDLMEDGTGQEDLVWGSFEENTPEAPIAKEKSEAVTSAPEEAKESPTNKGAEVVLQPALATAEVQVAKKEPEVTAKKETAAPKASTTIKQKTGRFYIIMGVFTQDGYAERNLKQLRKKGYDAKILQPAHDRKRDRVSVADFATAQEAQAAVTELRGKINNELWVFNY